MLRKERNKNTYLNIQQEDYPKNDFTFLISNFKCVQVKEHLLPIMGHSTKDNGSHMSRYNYKEGEN